MDFTSPIVILAIALALGCDTFAVGLAIGTTMPSRRAAFRLWFHFGLFQGLMPVMGWVFGQTLLPLISEYDHWVAAGLLAIIAAHMLLEGLQARGEESQKDGKDPTRGWSLMALSFATSFDALGIGVGMGVRDNQPYGPSVVIGIVAAVMTYIGLSLGRQLSLRFGSRMTVAGALILFIIAYKLLEI